MPAQRFWFPGLEKKLSKVVWKVAGGLLYVHMEWSWGLFPATSGGEDTEVGSPAGSTPPNPYLITIANLPGYDPFQINVHQAKRGSRVPAPSIAKPAPGLEDPVTIGMLGYYAYWTPPNSEPPFYFTASRTSGGLETWIVDTASWQLVYNHIITNRVTPPMSQAAGLAQFQGLAGSTGYEGMDPALMGVIIEQVFTFIGGIAIPPPHDPPYPPSADGYAFWASAPGWSGHMETSGGGTSRGAKGSANLLINVARVQQELTLAQKNANKWTFDITMPEDQLAKPYVSVSAWPATKSGTPGFTPRKTFPVGTTMQRPLFEDVADSKVQTGARGAADPGVKANTRFRVTVQIKPLKVLAMELISGGLGAGVVIG